MNFLYFFCSVICHFVFLIFSVWPLICYLTRISSYPKSGALFCKVQLWIRVPVQLIQSQFLISHVLTIGNMDTVLAGASLTSSGETY